MELQDTTPQFLMQMNSKLDKLIELQSDSKEDNPERILTIEEARDYEQQRTGRKPARQTIYDRINRHEMPYVKNGKYLGFVLSELKAWFDNGRRIIK